MSDGKQTTYNELKQASIVKLLRETEAAKKASHISDVILKNITSALPQYVYWKDTHSTYLGCNQNYARLHGFDSPDGIIGKTDYDLKWLNTGSTAESFQDGDKETIAGKPIDNCEELLALPDGKEIATLVSKVPIRDDDGTILGILGYVTDISELKQKEAELAKAKREAEAASEAKSTFLTNMSHDIRTPLTGMLGMAEVLRQHVNSAIGIEYANNLVQATNVLLNLLNEIIEITRLDATQLPINCAQFNLRDLLNDIESLVKPSATQKNLSLKVNWDNSLPLEVIGDATRIHRIILNLVSNAIKFTSLGGVIITVDNDSSSTSQDDLILRICVEDTGIGIADEQQDIIFSQFTRLTPAHQNIYSGAGLGLSIVKKFIDELGGRIELSSEVNKGSIFTCLLPVKKISDEIAQLYDSHLDEEQEEHTSEMSYQLPKLPLNVLLVEDNQLSQIATVVKLTDLNCQVDAAETAKIALQMAEQKSYDIIFMDLGLPDSDGFAVTEGIRAGIINKHTPIIALTAHGDDELHQACLDIGMQSMLTKPLVENLALNIFQRYLSYAFEPEDDVMEDEYKVIDLALGRRLAGGNDAAARDMLAMLMTSIPPSMAKMKQAYQQQDWQALAYYAHKMHGGCCYCGVPRLKLAVKQVEQTLKRTTNTTMIANVYELLQEELTALLEEYQVILSEDVQ